jgi:hypothetical protein
MSSTEGRSSTPPAKPLQPARLDPEELEGRPSYMPRVPWRTVFAFGSLLVLMVAGYQLRERQRTDALREKIVDTYETHLRSLSDRYMTFRERIERWTMEAGRAGAPETYVDPRLNLEGLHSATGLYLRIPARMTETPDTVGAGAIAMTEDAISRCLGVAPASARGLWDSGVFLDRTWLDEVRASSDFMRLRVVDEQLARNTEVDVPVLTSMMGAQYFLLILEQGDNRRDAPVDVFMWDLRSETQLLRARVQADGVLLPVRIQMAGAPSRGPSPSSLDMATAGASDCSIASKIRALTGGGEVEIQNAPTTATASQTPPAP